MASIATMPNGIDGSSHYICLMRSMFLFCTMATTAAFAQWEVPVRLQLDGASDAERQVVGVAAPIAPDAAVSLEAARSLSTSFTYVSGSDVLSGSLTPAPTAFIAGMLLTIVPVEMHSAGAQLSLNGLPPVAIVRQDGNLLQAGDLPMGVPSRLAFDGVQLRLLSAARLKCPTGYTAGSNDFCIADSARTATSFWTANVRCGNAGARLCTVSEWVTACNRIPGFFATVPEAEWIDHAGNNVSDAKVIGYGSLGYGIDTLGAGCDHGSWSVTSALRTHRCCTSR